MAFNGAEYNSLRAELGRHDNACLNILGLLLAASTAIYGLVANERVLLLLPLLSVIWLVGCLVNPIWLWAERSVSLAIVATLLFLIFLVWSSLILKKYYSFSRRKHTEPSLS